MAAAKLSSPLKVGEVTLRNRVVMASLTRSRSVPTNVPNEVNVEYYRQRAAGGAGLILTEGTLISLQGTEWPHAPGIWSEEQANAWKNVTEAVHAEGSLIFCQLWHVGRVAHPDMPDQKLAGVPVPGPSAISARGGKFRMLPGEPGYVQPMELDDPRTIIAQFKNAAEMAKRAGFDGVELHSANGYIIHQFLDNTANKRTDQWGGSVENRTRLGLEVIKVLIDVWGAGRVGIKISPAGGYNDMGMSLPETYATFVHYVTELAALKIAYIQLARYSAGMDEKTEDFKDKANPLKRGTPHDVLAVYGPLVKVPGDVLVDHDEGKLRGPAMPSPNAQNPTPTRLFVNSGLTPTEARQLLDEDKIDVAVFGRFWIANPDLYKRLEKGADVGGKGINETYDYYGFYNFPAENPGKGYTDYPPME